MEPAGIIWQGDLRYEKLRRGLSWNARVPDRFPAGIVRALGADHVAGIVAFARSRGIQVSVRSGGHNWGGAALRDGCIVVDVARLDQVLVTPQDEAASAGPGVDGGRLLAALEPHSLAFPVGHHRNVALGGYLLGGGVGWNANFLGIACSNVRGVELISAEGGLIAASPESHPDLFWAARGGGSSFPGIITRYDLAVFPAARVMAYRDWRFPLSCIGAAAGWARSAAARMGPRGEVLCWAGIDADHAGGTPGGGRVIFVRTLAFAESEAQAQEMLASLGSLPVPQGTGRPAGIQRASWRQLFEWSDRLYPAGRRYAMDAMWLRCDPDEVLPELAHHIAQAPSPESRLMLSFRSAEPEPPSRDDLAFSSSSGDLYVLVETIWQGAAQDSANLHWLDGLVKSIEPLAAGFTMNGSDWLHRPERTRRCFPEQKWRRLAEIARRYDPDNMFFTLADG